MNPLCPFCHRELSRLSDNPSYEAWGCDGTRPDGSPCGTYVNRAKPRAPKPDPMTPISQIEGLKA